MRGKGRIESDGGAEFGLRSLLDDAAFDGDEREPASRSCEKPSAATRAGSTIGLPRQIVQGAIGVVDRDQIGALLSQVLLRPRGPEKLSDRQRHITPTMQSVCPSARRAAASCRCNFMQQHDGGRGPGLLAMSQIASAAAAGSRADLPGRRRSQDGSACGDDALMAAAPIRSVASKAVASGEAFVKQITTVSIGITPIDSPRLQIPNSFLRVGLQHFRPDAVADLRVLQNPTASGPGVITGQSEPNSILSLQDRVDVAHQDRQGNISATSRRGRDIDVRSACGLRPTAPLPARGSEGCARMILRSGISAATSSMRTSGWNIVPAAFPCRRRCRNRDAGLAGVKQRDGAAAADRLVQRIGHAVVRIKPLHGRM